MISDIKQRFLEKFNGGDFEATDGFEYWTSSDAIESFLESEITKLLDSIAIDKRFDEFIEATELWHENLRGFCEPQCPICGIVPKKMVKLAEAMKKIQEQINQLKN